MAKKRTDGRYQAAIYLGRDEEGRRRYKYVYATSKAELKQKETAIRAELDKGVDLLAARDDFGSWADAFLAIKEAGQISEKQLANYRHSVELWKGQFQGLQIGQVGPEDIERVLISMARQGYSQRTIAFHRGCVRQILKRATGRAISTNPETAVDLGQIGAPPTARRALTEAERQMILDTPGRGQAVAVIMMYSGLRRGELAALTWEDVDLDGQTINVNKSVEYMENNSYRLKPMAKTEAGMRVVDIPRTLCDYLSTMDRRGPLVIPSAAGRTMTASAWVKLWRSYMRTLRDKYGDRVPPMTLHWLRHTYCTMLYHAGVDVLQAKALMGHANVTTTLKIYTHLDQTHKRKGLDRLEAYLDHACQDACQKPLK